MTRWDFAPKEVKEAMKGKPHRHDIVRDVCEKVIGKHYKVARPGKTAFEATKRSRKG